MKLVVGLVSAAVLVVSVGVGVPAAVGEPSSPAGAAALLRPTLAVVVLGSGSVASKPAGISCPGKCTATFAAGTSVLLSSKPKHASRFLRWGGSCSGTRACRVKVSTLSAVAAQFAPGVNTKPPPVPRRTAAEPGSYYVDGSPYRTFFVAPGGGSVLNIAIASVGIACTPAASSAPSSDYLVIANAAIRPDGSFVGKGSQSGVFAGSAATFTYSFAGHLRAATAGQAANAAGSLREDVVFKDNVTHKCTSNTQSWSAAKLGPIPPPTSLVQEGSYYVDGSPYRTFSVAADRRSMLNISIASVSIVCTPAASRAPSSDKIVIAQAAIKADGSFAGTASQSGVFAGSAAKFTYSFSGNFHGLDRSAHSAAAGLLREDIVFTDAGGSHTCTSNDQIWTASRSS